MRLAFDGGFVSLQTGGSQADRRRERGETNKQKTRTLNRCCFLSHTRTARDEHTTTTMPDDYGYPIYAAGSKSYEPFRLVNVYKKASRETGCVSIGGVFRVRSSLCWSPVAGGTHG